MGYLAIGFTLVTLGWIIMIIANIVNPPKKPWDADDVGPMLLGSYILGVIAWPLPFVLGILWSICWVIATLMNSGMPK